MLDHMDLQSAVDSEMKPAEIAKALGVSQGRGSQIAALRKLSPEQRAAIWSGRLSPAHGYQLSRLREGQRRELYELITRGGKQWTRDSLKQKVDAMLRGRPAAEVAAVDDPNIRALAAELTTILATTVDIRHERSGAGTIVIKYFSVDQMDGLLEILKRGPGHGS